VITKEWHWRQALNGWLLFVAVAFADKGLGFVKPKPNSKPIAYMTPEPLLFEMSQRRLNFFTSSFNQSHVKKT
jgi:hypothetical protein